MPAPSCDHAAPSQRATKLVEPPKGTAPAAATSPFGSSASALTPPTVPVPSGVHVAPFHRATLFALAPPAVPNQPPTTTSPFGSGSRAFTLPVVPFDGAKVAVDGANVAAQPVPFQRATWLAATPPAARKYPNASTSALGRTASASTSSSTPEPSGDQPAPSKTAMRFTFAAPAWPKSPPATTPPPGSGASAVAALPSPPPSADQLVPSQRAMLATLVVPELAKKPLATRSPFGNRTRDWTAPPPGPLKPAPSADHVDPFQRATLLTIVPPAVSKRPPTTTSPPGSVARQLPASAG